MGGWLGTKPQIGGVSAMETPAAFVELVAKITARVGSTPLSPELAAELNALFPPDGADFAALEAVTRRGVEQGWLCAREHGGVRFGRPVRPGPATHGFSVDVVEMADIVGPHHVHPNGEIDMVLPLDETARFDGSKRGWKVYGPGSAHKPTVTGGKALILYLLPQGAIEYT